MRPFTPDDIQRLIVNPFYAITVAPSLVSERSSLAEEVAEWLVRNATALGLPTVVGAASEVWLRRLLDVLQHDADAADPVNPARAIAIEPIFAVEHAPLIDQAAWVQANSMLLCDIGALAWLDSLLQVLEGDFVAAPDADLAPPRLWPPRSGRSIRRPPHAHRRSRH